MLLIKSMSEGLGSTGARGAFSIDCLLNPKSLGAEDTTYRRQMSPDIDAVMGVSHQPQFSSSPESYSTSDYLANSRSSQRRRCRTELSRRWACPIHGCNRRYEEWRSLHYHLREFHKTNMFKADYKELFGMDGQGSAGSPPRHNRATGALKEGADLTRGMTMTDMTRMPSHASDAIAAPSGPVTRPAGRGGSDAQAIMYAMSRRTVSTDGNIEHSWRHPGSYDGAHGPDTAAQLSRSGPMRVESRYRAMPPYHDAPPAYPRVHQAARHSEGGQYPYGGRAYAHSERDYPATYPAAGFRHPAAGTATFPYAQTVPENGPQPWPHGR